MILETTNLAHHTKGAHVMQVYHGTTRALWSKQDDDGPLYVTNCRDEAVRYADEAVRYAEEAGEFEACMEEELGVNGNSLNS